MKSTDTDGIIENINVDEGSQVSSGDLLLNVFKTIGFYMQQAYDFLKESKLLYELLINRNELIFS